MNASVCNSNFLSVFFKDQIPDDLYENIFKMIRPADLSKLSCVSKEVERLVKDGNLWHHVIRNHLAFGARECMQYFNHNVQDVKLPADIYGNIMDMINCGPHEIRRPPLVVLFDPTLTMKKIGELVKDKLGPFERGYTNIPIELLKEDETVNKDNALKSPYWIIMTNGVIGKCYSYDIQEGMVKRLKNKDGNSLYQIPSMEEAAFCIYAKYISTGQCQFAYGRNGISTRTTNVLGNSHVRVGDLISSGYMSKGLDVGRSVDMLSLGVAYLQKLG